MFFPGHLDYTLLNQYSCDWWWKPKNQPTLHCVFMYWDLAIVYVEGTCDVTAEEDDTDYFTTMDTDSVSGVSSVTTEETLNWTFYTSVSLSLPLRPPKITSCAVSAPAPGPGLHDCMLQRHSQAIIVKIISCWCHKPFTLDVSLYFIYIFLHGNLGLKLFLLFTSCSR